MKRTVWTPIITILAIALAAAPPLDAANREHQQMMADIRMLQEQSQLLQNALAALTDAVKMVSAKLDEQAGQNRKTAADAKVLIDNLGRDVGIVREKIDDTNVRISTLSQEMDALRLSIPPTQPVAPAGTGTPPSPDQPPVDATPSAAGLSPTRMFETARSDYGAGQFTLAISGFEGFIKSFSKSEQADDARLYIGQSHYSAGNFKEAIAAFDDVIQTYPTSNAVPDAYYKRGLALDRIGQVDRARESFQTVIKNHPDSDAARMAKQALDRMRLR